MQPLIRFVAVGVGALVAFGACGGAPAPKSDGAGYTEYTCPDPIGKIVREDCSKSQLKYDGKSFEGSVGAMGVGASATYKESAVREADALVSMLKEQRGQLCNNFNTCKMTVAEYRDDQRKLDDSFVALMALKDKMTGVDAAGAERLLDQIRSIRAGAKSAEKPAVSAPPSASSAQAGATPPVATAPAPITSATATSGFACKGPTIQVARRGTIAGPSFAYDKTRDVLKGHPELAEVEWVEFLLETDTLSGKKQEFVLVAISPTKDVAEKARKVLKEKLNPASGVDIACPSIAPARKLSFDVM